MAFFQLCVSPVLMQNLQIWDFHRNQLDILSLCCATVSNMSHFVILFGIKEKNACFELPAIPVVAVMTQKQNEEIWNFHGSLN